jgi:uncharacterized protein YigA (DUF484 family)
LNYKNANYKKRTCKKAALQKAVNMTPDAVVNYLKQHPEFFEEQAEFLATIMIPHPHGGRAIPISERQILTLRDKSKQLEDKLRELIVFGEENDAIGEKLHRLTLALVAARDVEAVVAALYFNLREDFAVPHTVLRLWPEGAHPQAPEFASVSAAARDFADSLAQPYCSAHAMVDTAEWFGEASGHLRFARDGERRRAAVLSRNGHPVPQAAGRDHGGGIGRLPCVMRAVARGEG